MKIDAQIKRLKVSRPYQVIAIDGALHGGGLSVVNDLEEVLGLWDWKINIPWRGGGLQKLVEWIDFRIPEVMALLSGDVVIVQEEPLEIKKRRGSWITASAGSLVMGAIVGQTEAQCMTINQSTWKAGHKMRTNYTDKEASLRLANLRASNNYFQRNRFPITNHNIAESLLIALFCVSQINFYLMFS